MNTHNADLFWQNSVMGCEAALTPWLRDHGSLTLRIQQRCTRFAVHGVRDGLARIALDEAVLLGVAQQHLAWSREVFLYADGIPIVFAHSTCARQHLRGAWSALGSLGDMPLGALLFAHPLVKRKPLHYKALRSIHSLYQRATVALSNPPDRLWARRSLFYLHGAPLLVTEVFLPEILRLAKSAHDSRAAPDNANAWHTGAGSSLSAHQLASQVSTSAVVACKPAS